MIRVHTVYFQGQKQDLAVHSIPLDFPKYRLDNGRTRSAQAAYIARHQDLPDNFFQSDSESDAAQRAQHDILKTMLGGGPKDLLRFFKGRDQMQPFILTEYGFVLNGNRRLCAFRELVAQDKEANQERLANIQVVILPPADERALDKLEAFYQLTEDIKEAYSWTARAYMLRSRQREHGFDEKELSAIYEIPRSEVTELLNMLSLAEEYLDDRGISNQYERVDENEFAFRQLVKTRNKLKDEAEKTAVQQLSFCAIENWQFGRLYSVVPRIAENLHTIRTEIAAEFPGPAVTKESNAATLLGVKSITLDPITMVLEDEKNHEAVREIISEVLDSAEEKSREKKRGNRVLTRLSKASDLLAGVLGSVAGASELRAINAKLKEIEATVAALREKLNATTKN